MRGGQCWGWPEAPGDAQCRPAPAGPGFSPLAASSLSRFAGQGTGFTGSSWRRGEGGLRRGQGLILVPVAGWRPGQASLKPLTHPGGSPSVIQREGSCPSKLGDCGNTCGQFAGQEIGIVLGSKLLTLLLFPFPSSPTNKPHFPGPIRPKELPGASLETISLQQNFAFAWVKHGGWRATAGENLICR